MNAPRKDDPRPLSKTSPTLRGRVQRRALLLDIIGDDLASGRPSKGQDALSACKERFGESMDTQDFYLLRRAAWDEILGTRPPGSHRIKPKGSGSPMAILTAEETFLLHKRYQEIRSVFSDAPPFAFTTEVAEALVAGRGTKLVVDRYARIVETEGRRPEIVAYPVNAMLGRFSRTFSIKVGGEYLTDAQGRRRAWSTRAAAEQEIRSWSHGGALVNAPRELRSPLDSTPPTGRPEDAPEASTKREEALNRWWSDRCKAKVRQRREGALVEILISKEDPEETTRLLPALLDAIEAYERGLTLTIETTDADVVVVVTKKESE